MDINSVEVNLDIEPTFRSYIRVTSISPDGTESVLIDRPKVDSSDNNNINFRTSNTHYRREDSSGT